MRFLIFAIGLAAYAPAAAAAGGTAAGVLLLSLAWSAPDLYGGRQLGFARRVIGAGLLLTGIALGFSAADFSG